MGRARGCAAAIAGAVLAAALGCARDAPPERIVLVVVDTLRRDFVSAYGGSVSTPALDGLAAEGQRFDRALAAFHQTSMSMGALFTGRTPSLERGSRAATLPWNGSTWCGLARYRDAVRDRGACLPASLSTLAAVLRERGYWTIGVASNQFLFAPAGFDRGFDDWVEVGDRPARMRALDMLTLEKRGASRRRTGRHVHAAAVAALDRRPSDRFFLYVHYMDVHDYVSAAREGTPERAAYAAAVQRADRALGRLLEALAERGLDEDALVVVTSDHGERLGEAHPIPGRDGHRGNPSFQEVLRVPLIARPGLSRDPAATLRSQDLPAAIAEAAGARAAALAGSDLEEDELLVTEVDYRTFLKGAWKSLVRREDGRALLFDLAADPGEREDLASRHPEIVEAHRLRGDALAEELAAEAPARRGLSDEERARLRALGYLD